MQKTIEKVIQDIWNNLEKPSNFAKYSLEDLFDISFFFMPPLVYYKDLFDQRVQELYSRFANRNDPKYYFDTKYHRQKSVPCDGLYTWTSQIWESVSKDESLNIPDQQKLLATYRCEHALAESFAIFTKNIQAIEQELSENGYVVNFGNRIDFITKETVEAYNDTGNKYDKDIAQSKSVELVERMESKILQMFHQQLEHITREIIALFGHKLKKGCRRSNSQNECIDDLEGLVKNTAEDVRKQFSMKLDESTITSKNPNLTNKELYWSKMMERLRETIKSVQNEQWMILLKENEVSWKKV